MQTNGRVRKILHTIGTGGSFGAGSLQAEIGLGDAKEIKKISIRWPNAKQTIETHKNLFINKFYRVVEGEKPQILDKEHIPFTKISKMKKNHK